MRTGLTQKQEIFCLNLFQGMSQREAYVQAGYSPNQAPTTLDQSAWRLANTPKILQRGDELKQAAVDASVATVLERKQILSEIMRGRFADFMANLTPEKLKSAALQEIRITTTGLPGEKHTTIKLHSPIQAIAELNKMDKIYTEGGASIINQILNINVVSESARMATERILQGERTE